MWFPAFLSNSSSLEICQKPYLTIQLIFMGSYGQRSLVGCSPRGHTRVGYNLVMRQQRVGTSTVLGGCREEPLSPPDPLRFQESFLDHIDLLETSRFCSCPSALVPGRS